MLTNVLISKSENYYLLFIIAISLGVSHAFSQSAPHENELVLKEMRDLKEEYKLPSFSLAVGIGDEIVFAEAVGHQDMRARRRADVRTQYSVGSLAKPMTGIALARLVDMGKVDLDAPASDYVETPAYTKTFTVRQLASHVAGVPHDTAERELAEFVDVRDHESPFDAFSVFSSHPLLFEPGTDFEYSSNGYILLSAVIENAANMNYVDFLESMIWSELGMTSTELDTSFAGKENEANYYSDITSANNYVQSESKRDRSFLFGGGGFISTPSDLVRMARATYPGKFLSVKSRQEMRTPTMLDSGEMNSQKYALGWRVGAIELADGDGQKWPVLHHGGVTDKAATSFLLVVPDCKASIAFVTNYIPEEFWKMRPRVAGILKLFINPGECHKSLPIQP